MPKIGILLLAGLVPALCAANQPLDGVWRSEGYGYVFEIHGTKLTSFEVTAKTCLAGFSAQSDAVPVPGREVTFRTADGDVYFVRSGAASDHRLLHNDSSASDLRIDRLPRRPAMCDQPPGNTPIDNFEVFTRTWAENYISFDLKHTDWGKIVAASRVKITPQMSQDALFDLLEAMIKPFGDAHTFISAPKMDREFHCLRPGTDRVIIDLEGDNDSRKFRKDGLPKLMAITDQAYLRHPPHMYCNSQLQFGYIDDTTGYLRILSFSGYAKGGFAEGLQALESALDEIFADFKLQSLVLDLRINFGGDDPYGLAIASRLATSDYLAYTKQARVDPVDHDKWTPGDPSTVKPSKRPGFKGPAVLLTGPLTISAGETFTQALMGRTPHVTRIGENTQGVFSDVLVRRLPNGWIFGLPNEVYRTPEGKTFDGPGIPPDMPVPVFAMADVQAGKDPAMAAALQLLKRQN